jgi:branched-chain amino acid transport system ATP-binding protein
VGALLRTTGLSKRFGGLTAVDDVSLDVEPGEVRAIIGPNGSGKTTLFNLISRTLEATAGRIEFRGQDITHLPAHRVAHLGLARSFQITSIFPELSVFENLRVAVQARRTMLNFWREAGSLSDVNARAEALLETTGMAARRDDRAGDLSHGEQRYLEIALALAADPVLLLLDEPTAGMSPKETADVVRFIEALRARLTILLVEHDMDVVMAIAGRITVLHHGRVIADGPPDAIARHAEVRAVYLGPTLE